MSGDTTTFAITMTDEHLRFIRAHGPYRIAEGTIRDCNGVALAITTMHNSSEPCVWDAAVVDAINKIARALGGG